MNWLLGNKGKSNVSSQTNLQAHRVKQIDSLKKFNPGCIETIPQVEYRVPLQINDNNITLVVTLPPLFPQDPPTVKVEPAVNHPWVDQSQMVYGCQGLRTFSMHTSLGQVVQTITEEFKRNPPQILSSSYPLNMMGNMFNMVPQVGGAYPSPPTLPQQASNNHTSSGMPFTPAQPNSSTGVEHQVSSSSSLPDMEYPELQGKSLSQLNEMLNDEDKILEIIQNMPKVLKLAEDREKLSNECIELARQNLSKKPAIEQLRQWILDKNDLFNKMTADYEDSQAKLISQAEQFHPTNIQTNLKVALLEAEEESENIVQDMLHKKISMEEFTSKFLEKRKLCHSRRAKEEKLNQIILRQGYS